MRSKKISKTEKNSPPVRGSKLPTAARFFFVFLLAVVAVTVLSLSGVALAYKNKFYPGVRVGGISLAGKSEQAGKEIIANQVKQYQDHKVIVTVPNINEARSESTGEYPDLEITTTAKELGAVFQDQEAVSAGWQVGHDKNILSWAKGALQSIFVGKKYPLAYSVDQTQITTFINTNIVPKVITPTPAKIIVDGADVEIDDPKPGLAIDQDELAKKLLASLSSATEGDVSYLRAPVEVVDSQVTRQSLQTVADQLDALGNLKLTMSVQDLILNPKRDQLLNWFVPVQDEQGAVTLDVNEEAVESYLQKNGKNMLSQSASVKAVTKVLANYAKSDAQAEPLTKPVTVGLVVKPALDTTPGNVTLGMFEGKYIQVNLSEQKLYLVNGSTLEKTYRISSGKWSTPTPKGDFKINNKIRRAYSRTYGLYMPFWQNFVALDPNSGTQVKEGEFGLHELPEWPNGYKEGQNHIGTPVSHGCIRLGVGAAEEVYNWSTPGIPLIIR